MPQTISQGSPHWPVSRADKTPNGLDRRYLSLANHEQ